MDFVQKSLRFASRRSNVMSLNGMVSCSHPMASSIGLDILKDGGNAADACIAMAAALNVVEPCSTGIGGDMFSLFYDANTKEVTAINGSGRSPAKLSMQYLRDNDLIDGDCIKDEFHPICITVPGACAGWFDLLEQKGSRKMMDLLNPSIRLAEEGFPVSEISAHGWTTHEATLQRQLNGDHFLINGKAPRSGQVFKNADLASTFREIGEKGRNAFYTGAIAEAIVRTVQEAGGVLEMSDMKKHVSTFEPPISTVYKNKFKVHECAPNGQGLAALIALNICETFDWKALSPALQMHVSIEAMRLAFMDARSYIGDPAHAKLMTQELLSKDYAKERAKLISLKTAKMHEKGTPANASNTVYFCAADRFGNVCSFINSNYNGFGSAIVPKGWGFSLQNRGHNFYCGPDASHPNLAGPEKRSYHTIIPALVTDAQSGEWFAGMGVMGAFMQPQGHLQTFLSLFEDGMTPQEALDKCRFCIDIEREGGVVLIEEGVDAEIIDTLKSMNHKIKVVSSWDRKVFGRGQIIMRDDNKVLHGGCDPRSDGLTLGH